MKKIICFVGSMNAGGAETFLMKIYRRIDKTKYQFDFIVSTKDECFYDKEILALGGHLYYVPPKSKNPFLSFWHSYKVIKNHQYVAALRMTSHSLGVLDLLVAKLAGVHTLVLRSTNAGNTGGKISRILHQVFSFLPRNIPTVKFAPSELAAEYLFGKDDVLHHKVQILHNALPLNDYVFDGNIREQKRKELEINKTQLLIGHVGRFNIQKNHAFLIDVFYRVQNKVPSAMLLLVGTGEEEQHIKNKIHELGIEEKVIFAGVRRDVPQLFMAMDVLVFPSIFEGMPNVVIEAQATGLPCLISDKITKEAVLNDNVEMLSLDDQEPWVKRVCELPCDGNREFYNKNLEKQGYDIDEVASIFQKDCFL